MTYDDRDVENPFPSIFQQKIPHGCTLQPGLLATNFRATRAKSSSFTWNSIRSNAKSDLDRCLELSSCNPNWFDANPWRIDARFEEIPCQNRLEILADPDD
ncbi:unnamed protein product [Victoria cruziana]